METVNVGLIGFGTVGAGVVKALRERSAFLKKKLGVAVNLKKICDKDIATPRSVKVDESLLTTNADEILKDPEISIVIELIGGISPAKEFIIAALRNGKDVITANKALLAQAWGEIFAAANESGREVYFEGSVGGGIPIIKSLREGLISNQFQALFGIVNGTSNYILTRMKESDLDFKDALKEAQDKGYAERDPSLDIKGTDSAHKLAILASLCFGMCVRGEDIHVEGIQDISGRDIKYADEFGYTIKLLAIAKKVGEELEVRVHPTLLPKNYLLASVGGAYNAIYVRGDLIGVQLFYGQGAGPAPTSSAVVSDLMDLVQLRKFAARSTMPNLAYEAHIKKIRKIDEIESRYYIRLMAVDRPGVLAAISGVFGRHEISIASVIQRERKKEQVVPIVLMTHDAKESNLRSALTEIDALGVVKRKSVAIRIERKL